jgi:prepilin-type N-terminal cleavage/methylation domain-containing protein
MLQIGQTSSAEARGEPARAFTLIEFILVMALLAIAVAFVAPSLSGFFKGRAVTEEAARMKALTDFGRSEAISQGVPMTLWLDAENRRYGLRADTGYPVRTNFLKEYTFKEEVEVTVDQRAGASLAPVNSMGFDAWTLAVFQPDGSLGDDTPDGIYLQHTSGSLLILARATNGLGYEILEKEEYELRQQEAVYEQQRQRLYLR